MCVSQHADSIKARANAALCLGLHAMTDATHIYNAHGQSEMQHDNSGVQKVGKNI